MIPGLVRGLGLAALFALLAAAPVLAGDSVAGGGPLPDGRLSTVSALELARIGVGLSAPVDVNTPDWVRTATRAGLPSAAGSLFVQRRVAVASVTSLTATRIAAGARVPARPLETELVYASTRDTLTPCPRWRRNCTIQISDRQLCWAVVLQNTSGARELVLVDASTSGVVFTAPIDS